jgi:hypothetical protein
MIAVGPAPRALAAAASSRTPNCIHTTFAPMTMAWPFRLAAGADQSDGLDRTQHVEDQGIGINEIVDRHGSASDLR